MERHFLRAEAAKVGFLLACRRMPMTIPQITLVALIGLCGGLLGGLLGLGGSVFIIPALTLALGTNQHLYQASALIVNVFVAMAATARHRGRGTIRADIVPAMVASSTTAAILGVLVSNMLEPRPLAAVFGLFLCYAAVAELVSLYRRTTDGEPPPIGPQRWRLGLAIGFAGGFASGLLGIGGGAVMVPLLRKFAKLPVRQAVASSATAMVFACCIGAVSKNLSVSELTDASGAPLTLAASLTLAALLSPTATLGGHFGASLVYRLPTRVIRFVLSGLLAFAGVRMLLTGGPHLLDALQRLM